MEEDIVLERYFKPVIEPIKQIVENTAPAETVEPSSPSPSPSPLSSSSLVNTNVKLNETLISRRKAYPEGNLTIKTKGKRSRTSNKSFIASTPIQPKRKRLNCMRNESPMQHESPMHPEIQSLTIDDDEVFGTTDESLLTSVRHQLQASEGQETFRSYFSPLGQKYMGRLTSSDKDTTIDYVYGVHFDHNEAMLGDKKFNVDEDDNIIVAGVRYMGTPGLYELIFMRIPDDTTYTEADKQKYRSILLATNAHRRGYNSQSPIMGNKGYKYKHVIAPLISQALTNKAGRGLMMPKLMTVSNNQIDYIHWDDPNELVDRMRLIEASRQAGNNSHDNEFLSIVEELREAGLIIN